jgi:succinate-semialdehyde dehydrogenase/glutarate-semialdehyde dehydrogenase
MSASDVKQSAGMATPAIEQLVAAVPKGLLIGDDELEASDGATFDVLDPATGAKLTSVASASAEDGVRAVDAAQAAAADWAATAPRQRGEILRRAFELMIERKDDLAALITAEMGKVLADSAGEVTYAAEFFRWYSEEAVRIPGDLRTAPAGTNRFVVGHRPIGISVLVTPWNFPAAMATRKIGPAVAAGCTMILKPASDTPLTALAMAKILREAGLPAGVLNVVPSRRSGPVVDRMLHDNRVRKLSFTGSTEVGVGLLRAAADNVISTSMELGGNAPFIVFEDADLDAAVDGAMIAKMRNGGEACTAANRFIVQESVAEEFGSRLTERMRSLRIGPGLEPGNELGPVINIRARTDIGELVDGAVKDGAKVLTGGEVPSGDGYFYPATVLADVPPSATILGSEIFGPVAPIVTFETESEAIRLANATTMGLASYLYTRDLARGLRVSEQIQSGMVGLNRGLVSDPAAPFGGMKQSGLGREGGSEGILEYLETQYVATDW